MGGLAINTGDTAFVLICAALVALMTPGLAFFYGGLVRRKNFLAIMMQSFISMGVVTTIWVFFGYSLAFSGDIGGVFGNLSWAALTSVGHLPGPWAPNIPAQAHFVYQEMFAIITPALITGAFADRVKFKSYLWFLVLWSILVYIPFVHWIWGGGWLAQQGVLDFAGGIVVHVSAGFAALASVFVVGRRKFGPGERGLPHNIAFVAPRHRPAVVRLVRLQRRLGAGGQRHRRAGVRQHRHRRLDRDVHLAGDHLVEGRQAEPRRRAHRRRRRPRLHHAGAPATSRPGRRSSSACSAGSVCYFAVLFKERMKWDDALDVWACHGVGGVLGTILLGVFALKSVNPAGADGLIAGNWSFFGWQVLATVVIAAYAFVATFLILKLINAFGSIRVPDAVELKGLDEGELGEAAYNLT